MPPIIDRGKILPLSYHSYLSGCLGSDVKGVVSGCREVEAIISALEISIGLASLNAVDDIAFFGFDFQAEPSASLSFALFCIGEVEHTSEVEVVEREDSDRAYVLSFFDGEVDVVYFIRARASGDVELIGSRS